jgi:type II secretory pathway pseudopilin PulG
MSRRPNNGASLLELVTVLAVITILAAVAVPGAASAGRSLAGADAAQRLALVLRAAQAQAQACSCRVDVSLAAGGGYQVRRAPDGRLADQGDLGVAPDSNYSADGVSFNAAGTPCILGTSTARAGNFSFGQAAGHTVVLQLGGCIRCR